MTSSLHKKLQKRAETTRALISGVTPKTMVKSPSEKHSESLRKKLMRGRKPELEYQFDCNGCTECRGGHFLRTCQKPRRIEPCRNCGRLTMYRIDETKTFDQCPQCRTRLSYAKVSDRDEN